MLGCVERTFVQRGEGGWHILDLWRVGQISVLVFCLFVYLLAIIVILSV